MFYELLRYINPIGYFGHWVTGRWKSCGFFLDKEAAKTYGRINYPKSKCKALPRKFKDAFNPCGPTKEG